MKTYGEARRMKWYGFRAGRVWTEGQTKEGKSTQPVRSGLVWRQRGRRRIACRGRSEGRGADAASRAINTREGRGVEATLHVVGIHEGRGADATSHSINMRTEGGTGLRLSPSLCGSRNGSRKWWLLIFPNWSTWCTHQPEHAVSWRSILAPHRTRISSTFYSDCPHHRVACWWADAKGRQLGETGCVVVGVYVKQEVWFL